MYHYKDTFATQKNRTLGTSNPLQLLETVLCYRIHCIYYALRVGKEHHGLRSIGMNSQFSFQYDNQCVYYFCIMKMYVRRQTRGHEAKFKPKSVFSVPI